MKRIQEDKVLKGTDCPPLTCPAPGLPEPSTHLFLGLSWEGGL